MSAHFRTQLKIIVTMYIGYAAMMVCRQMVTILSPAMLADPTLDLTKTNIGDFFAYGTLGALVGKIIWGPLTDRIGGRTTFLLGIGLTAMLVTAFGMSANVMAFTAFSFLLYCTKSSGWPGMTKLVANWVHPNQYGRAWAILSTSSRASVVVGTLFFGWLLGQMHWRSVAYISAGVAIVILIICYFFLSDKPKDPDFIEFDNKNTANAEKQKEAAQAMENLRNHPLKDSTLTQGLMNFATSHRVWLIVVVMMVLTCMMAFLDFTSIYLMEVYQLTPAKAAMTSSVFPLGSLCGLLLSVAFYDRFSKHGIRNVLTITMLVALGCVLTLQYLPTFGLGEDLNFNIARLCIFLFGLSISPAYYIPMSVFSIEYGGPHSATLVCILDAFGFAASATFGFVGGRLADSAGGWDSFMNLLVIIILTATLSVWAFMHGEYRASKT